MMLFMSITELQLLRIKTHEGVKEWHLSYSLTENQRVTV